MHDIKAIRDDKAAFVSALARRPAYASSAESVADEILAKDKTLRDLQTELQQKQARRNEASKLIGKAKAQKDEAQAQALMDEVATIKDAIQTGEAKERELADEMRTLLAVLPNLPATDVPKGESEDDNVPVSARAFGKAPSLNTNKPKEHFEIGEALKMMDFERAAKVSGARFVYLKSGLAKLNRALASFMLDSHVENFGYTEVNPPLLVKNDAFFGTGQLPKFEEDLFFTDPVTQSILEAKLVEGMKAVAEPEGAAAAPKEIDVADEEYAELVARRNLEAFRYQNRFGLIPTAEISLTNYVNGEILDEAELPIRFTAYTPCFRSEAGAAGKDTRGMIRMHQFDKVELVSITSPDASNDEHERMTDAAQSILKKLHLHHRVVTLCAGDMGFGAKKTYDIEVWLPGQGRFREISSCSNCGDFQARRMNTRVRGKDGKVKGPVHTLNGSGLAIGRTLIAIMENYQQPDGTIAIPDALQPYMGGQKIISA
ncbi:MAG TPA: serine--tRNA ligase [Rhizomicrobium sp.]|jgi:seryl-tRNA synthetase|nr:serine--tRNA ligase [Rhizomicrobium sp.]